MKKTDENVAILAVSIVDAMDFGTLVEYAEEAQADYLDTLTEEEFLEEWEYFYREED